MHVGRGDSIASCDADGVLKLWDIRMVAEIGTIEVCSILLLGWLVVCVLLMLSFTQVLKCDGPMT